MTGVERAEQRSRRERQRKERQRQRRWAAVAAALEEALARATGAAAAQASLEVLRDLEAAAEPAQRMLQRASLVAACTRRQRGRQGCLVGEGGVRTT